MALFLLSNASNMIIIIGYLSKNVFWLRLISIIGLISALPFYYFQSEPLWAAISWNVAFVVVHSFRIQNILAERRSIDFSQEENAMYMGGFDDLTPQQFKKILKIGQWRDLEPGCQIQMEGNPAVSQIAILYGEIEARVKSRVMGTFGRGDFIGIGCITNNPQEFCDATVIQPSRVLCWSHRELMHLLAADQQLSTAMRKVAGASLASILMAIVQQDSP